MSLGNRNRRAKQFRPPKLMLTSMMDMFTIILIFLLFSFSDNPDSLQGLKDMELPRSTAEVDYSDSIRIVLTPEQLKLNDDTLAAVNEEEIVGLDPKDLKSSSLFLKLKEIYDTEKDQGEEGKEKRHVLFLCDRRHSFKTINTVIKTAGMAGFPNFQFGVLEGIKE